MCLRVYCQHLWQDLQRTLAPGVAPSRRMFELLEAVSRLEAVAQAHCPIVLGAELALHLILSRATWLPCMQAP